MNDDQHFYSHIPKLIKDDDPVLANAARLKFIKKSRLSRFFKSTPQSSNRIRSKPSTLSLPPLEHTLSSSTSSSSSPNTPPIHDEAIINRVPLPDITDSPIPITLDGTRLTDDDIYSDRYEWAVVYENQRGLTAFSTPYYSSLSLLPSDPSPFTLPNAPLARSKQPPISLDNYPLPDGDWHWVSRCWMIDMRSDTGEVQYDGFEYNWMFRRHGWRARVGSFNAGGWVRRRRWVRLMVRSAKRADAFDTSRPATLASTSRGPTPSHSISNGKKAHRQSLTSSFLQPSVYSRSTGYTGHTDPWSQLHPDDVWLGEDPEADWQRCAKLMKHLGRDGRKLELWSLWLGVYHPDHKDKFIDTAQKGKEARRQKQWTEDDVPMPSEVTAQDILSKERVAIAPKEALLPVLKRHTASILQQLIYPESRAQFIKLLVQSDLMSEIKGQLPVLPSEIDFWSYAEGIGALMKPEAVDKPSSNASTTKPRSLLATSSAVLQASPVRFSASEGSTAIIRITPFKSSSNATTTSHLATDSFITDVD
ncbi:hypothetical protein CVT24_008406 [Panaeolus cyanescens]|uniref:TECPR1-like DysF domain-containing protein n=1 Tax=Panaeolus cyanescens TaxID=181874 RepID=A0A409VBD9_9AGAR|nr:hypothetical protein CVT24_008406 [Panaeolus cyanescens]